MTTPADPGLEPERPQEQPAPAQASDQAPPERLTRRSILAALNERRRRNRPYIIAAWVVLALILSIPTYGFVQKFVIPPRELALRVQGVSYTRGDLVDFIRFHQRLSEQNGQQFVVGSSLFDALTTMSENEMAYQGAPALGVTVEPQEVDRMIQVLLGFVMTPEEAARPENKSQIDEALRQFLNNVGLSEATYRDIVRKDLFREKVRDRIGEDVDRIQEQVHVYEIKLQNPDQTTLDTIRRRLKAGDAFSDLALKYSIDPDTGRNHGELGWIPRRVMESRDNLFFGTNEDGTRVLPIGVTSDLIRGDNQDNNPSLPQTYYSIYYIDDYSSAREVDDQNFQTLKDRALSDWFDVERKQLDVYLVLDDKIYNWVNQQVRLNSILPTPTPATQLPGLGG